MPMKWKPDKPPARKREQKLRLERQKLRKEFAKNMEGAEALARAYHNGTNITAVYTGELEPKFVDWALSKYRHDKFNEEMSKLHKDMAETWREIVVTAEACAKATEARHAARDLQKRRPLLYSALMKQKRQQREAR